MRFTDKDALDRMAQTLAAQGPAALAGLTRDELLSIVESSEPPLEPELLEAIAMQDVADTVVIEAIVAKAGGDHALLTGIAGLNKTPSHVLQELARHPSRSVSEKARINLTWATLRTASVEDVMSSLDEHSGDSYVDVGVRYNLAADASTHGSVLRRLADDDVASIADLARDRLRGMPI